MARQGDAVRRAWQSAVGRAQQVAVGRALWEVCRQQSMTGECRSQHAVVMLRARQGAVFTGRQGAGLPATVRRSWFATGIPATTARLHVCSVGTQRHRSSTRTLRDGVNVLQGRRDRGRDDMLRQLLCPQSQDNDLRPGTTTART